MATKDNNEADDNKRIYYSTNGEGCYKVEIHAILCGNDLVVIISGGSKYHVGATALAVPRMSLHDPRKISATASVLTVTGHKEDELARQIALLIASAMNCTVTTAVGIHLDNATQKDIIILNENCFNAVSMIINDLKHEVAH